MSVKIGNMVLENNQLNHNFTTITLNHLDEFEQFIRTTKDSTIKAIVSLLDSINVKLILVNNELHVIKNSEFINDNFASTHYENILKYVLNESSAKSKENLTFIIGYNLLIDVLSNSENNKHLILDGIQIAKYISSIAWHSAFTSKATFDEYYIKQYENNRLHLFFPPSEYRNELKHPHLLAKALKINFGIHEELIKTSEIFTSTRDDIALINDKIITNLYQHTIEINTTDNQILNHKPNASSIFNFNHNNETYLFRTDRHALTKGFLTTFRPLPKRIPELKIFK